MTTGGVPGLSSSGRKKRPFVGLIARTEKKSDETCKPETYSGSPEPLIVPPLPRHAARAKVRLSRVQSRKFGYANGHTPPHLGSLVFSIFSSRVTRLWGSG